MYLWIFCLFFIVLVWGNATNRCGYIQDNRSVYTTKFDASNGHNILMLNMFTDNSSGFSWQNILEDRKKNDAFEPWVNCSISIVGGPFQSCIAERRGDWSMESPLPSLKVTFANKVEYLGMDRLLLNKHPWDPTRMKAKLTFEILQGVDNLSSLFTQFVNLTVNNIFYGLYTLVEDLDKHMLATHGLGTNSNLYKANYFRWDPFLDDGLKEVTDPYYKKEDFESHLDIRGAKNHTIILKALNEVYDANLDSQEVLERNFNIDNLAQFIAFVYLSANIDMKNNNYALYAPEESPSCQWPTPLYFVFWDADGSWADKFWDGSIIGVDYPYHDFGIQYFWRLRFVKRFFHVCKFVDLFFSKMVNLVDGPLATEKIRRLTEKYKPIIRPTLSIYPDIAHLAWDNATLAEWNVSVDLLSSMPTSQLLSFPLSSRRPMPIEMWMTTSQDGTSYFFYWSKSFVLYDKPFFYEFSLALNASFERTIVAATLQSHNTYFSLPASNLLSNTTYFWKVIVRNAETPSDFIESYSKLYNNSGWGIQNFSTPLSLPSPSLLPNVHQIKNSVNISGRVYATLDDVDPLSLSSLCSSLPLLIPEGWTFANNTNQTRSHVAELNLPWGGCELVLSDGTRIVAKTGKLIDGFGVFAHHLIEKAFEKGVKGYHANCTTEYNQRILITRLLL